MRLPNCVAIYYNLPWFCSIKVSNKKLQRNAENACENQICKRALTLSDAIGKPVLNRNRDFGIDELKGLPYFFRESIFLENFLFYIPMVSNNNALYKYLAKYGCFQVLIVFPRTS